MMFVIAQSSRRELDLFNRRFGGDAEHAICIAAIVCVEECASHQQRRRLFSGNIDPSLPD